MLCVKEDLGMMNFPKDTSRKVRVVLVECECGKEFKIRRDCLKSNRSCGCLRYKSKVEIPLGKKYGRLTVIKDLGIIKLDGSNTKTRCVECVCECGNTKKSQWSGVKYGGIRSCGCLRSGTSKEIVKIMQSKNVTHGDASKHSENHDLYNVWCSIKARCNRKNSDKYKYYGGKGIKVCDEWVNDYSKFKKWAVNNGYEKGLTIDRIDVLGNYEPSNCQWLTLDENRLKGYTIDKDRRERFKREE